MPIADLQNLRLHYELAGDGPEPVLLLSHSLGVNLSMWDGQADALGAHLRLLRYDTRGHGLSSVPSGPYTVEDLGKDVLALADFLGIDRFSFCGLSMGGSIGQWLGIHAPHRLHKLVLANTSPKFGTTEGWNTRIDLVSREGLAAVIPGTLERWFTADFRAARPETIAGTGTILRATDVRGYVACCSAVRDTDFRDSLGRVQVPTLLISGTHDPVSPPSDGHFLADGIAGSRYVELPAAHLSNVEASGPFSAALLEFLRV